MWNPFKKTGGLCLTPAKPTAVSTLQTWYYSVTTALTEANIDWLVVTPITFSYKEEMVEWEGTMKVTQNGFEKCYRVDVSYSCGCFVNQIKNDISMYLYRNKKENMKLKIPRTMMEHSVLVKFVEIENLHIAIPCNERDYNWFFPLGGTLEPEKNLEDLGAVEYVIRIGDKVRAWDYNQRKSITGTYKGLGIIGRDGNEFVGLGVLYSFLVGDEAFINIEPIKESKELIEAREALNKAKATVKATEILIKTLTS